MQFSDRSRQVKAARFALIVPSLTYTCGAAAALLLSCGDSGGTPTSTDETIVDSITGGAAAVASGGAESTGGQTASGGEANPDSSTSGTGGDQSAAGGAPAVDLRSFASGLNELLLDRPCALGTTLPLENGATCLLAGELHVETNVTFGGDTGTNYLVTLRVRGIWEPTKIVGGETPMPDVPLMVGGQVEPGSSDSAAINYQQFYLEVASPSETYWLNNHGYVAHDIHKADYEMTLRVEGGSALKVVANDGNNRQIANFPQESFVDLPPYDQNPTLGQFLRLDVVSVEVSP